MTIFLTGRYNLMFRSGVIGFPAADLVYMLTASDIPDWVVGQSLNQNLVKYRMLSEKEIARVYRQSPVSVVNNIRTPCLVIGGKEDLRTPWHQARTV